MTLKKRAKTTTINIGGKGGHSWPMKTGGVRIARESGGARMRTRGKRGQPQARGRELEVQISSKRAKRSRQELAVLCSLIRSQFSFPTNSAAPTINLLSQPPSTHAPLRLPESQTPSCGFPVFRPRLFLLTTQSTLFLFLLDELLCGPCLDLNSRLPPHHPYTVARSASPDQTSTTLDPSPL